MLKKLLFAAGAVSIIVAMLFAPRNTGCEQMGAHAMLREIRICNPAPLFLVGIVEGLR